MGWAKLWRADYGQEVDDMTQLPLHEHKIAGAEADGRSGQAQVAGGHGSWTVGLRGEGLLGLLVTYISILGLS